MRAIALLGLALALTPAQAFVRLRIGSSGPFARRSDATNVRFLINELTAPGLANNQGAAIITADSDPLGALQGAMDAWTNIETSNVAFASPGRTSQDSAVNDRQSIISFVDTPTNRSLVGQAVAVTLRVGIIGTGEIVDTDIIFSPTLTFSTTLATGSYDIQSVATHELGHALGADHSDLVSATMFFATRTASNVLSTLSVDDISFATEVYPEPAALASFGSISGTVRLASGGPVAGALMTAIDPATGVAVGAVTAADGTYAMPKVPAGRYLISAEPMDGPVLPEQFSAAGNGANTAFSTAILGGAASPQALQVSAGQNAAGDLTVESGAPALNIQSAGVGPVGQLTTFGARALPMRPGQVADIGLVGKGLDDPSLNETSISFFGAPITVSKGSVRRSVTTTGLPILYFTVQALPLSAGSGAAPSFTAAGVVNAGSFRGGAISAGEIVSIFGTGLGPANGVGGGLEPTRFASILVRSANAAVLYSAGIKILGGLNTSVGDVVVSFNGVRAPLFYASQGQINAQVPYEVAGVGNADVVVSYQGSPSQAVRMPVASAAPGLFVRAGSSQTIVLNQDGTVNDAGNPAARGSVVVIFATGQGLIGPPLTTGQLAFVAPLSRVLQPVSATIGGRGASVFFAGMTPQFVGLLQVNAEVPADAPTGSAVPLTLSVGGASAQSNVTLAVR